MVRQTLLIMVANESMTQKFLKNLCAIQSPRKHVPENPGYAKSESPQKLGQLCSGNFSNWETELELETGLRISDTF